MNDVIMIKYGEIILKGQNRPLFEEKLIKNIKFKINGLGEYKIKKMQATVYIEPKSEEYPYQAAIERLLTVFGIVSVTRARHVEKDMEQVKTVALECMETLKGKIHTFKVESKRSDKKFPLKSPDINQEVGNYLYDHLNGIIDVDVHHPDAVLRVEIRDEGAYVYASKEKGPGGLPVGINGKAALLLSGGIDSPAAGFLMARRGVELIGVHFHSYPYTSERAKQKVVDLAKVLTRYCDKFKLFVVPFTDIQLKINDEFPSEYMTLIMRRYMMKISEQIAENEGAKALITGESLGQVASQTMYALHVTNSAVSLPVFRPLIGLDKEDIVNISRRMGAFDISIQPYEDCCTVFTPKHPKTKPMLDVVERIEERVDMADLVQQAVDGAEVIELTYEAE